MIDVKKIQRRAQVFGTSALELMLIIIFLILLMFLTYVSSIDPSASAAGIEELKKQKEELAEIIDDSVKSLGPAESPEDARPHRLPARITNLKRQLETALAENKGLRARNEELARGDAAGERDWPPSIPLDEAAGYFFPTNSSEISPDFEKRLRQEIVPRILEISEQYNANVIEVVGHTDERPVSGGSTLDENLLPFLRGNPDVPLTAADNAGLGFARAAAVARVLRPGLSDESDESDDYYLTPLSAAQVILRNGEIADGSQSGDRRLRRRIEIRVRGREAPARGDSR